MKIGSNSMDIAPVAQARELEAGGSSAQARPANGAAKDPVALSTQASHLASVSLKGAHQGASAARMQELHAQFAAGTYEVDADAVAGKILDDAS